MCGIVAILGPKNIQHNSKILFNKMVHRGPDNTLVYYLNENGELGHKYNERVKGMFGFHRLAIRGAQEKYDQPFFIDDNTILLFNGELYNCPELLSKLEGNIEDISDTFILAQGIKQYGTDFIKLIKGMFSIVVIDLSKNTVFYCRDQFGIKPLFFLSMNEGIFLASEKNLLLQLQNSCALENQFSKKNLSISSVPKGILFCFDATLKSTQTSSLTPQLRYNRGEQIHEQEQVKTTANFKETFETTLGRMSVFDGAGALLLSSGIDSNALYICAQNLGLELQCYTFDYVEKKALSEFHLIEKHLNRNNVKPVEMNNTKILENFIEFCDENQSIEDEFSIGIQKEIYKVMSKDKIRVAFSGQGADEVWLGYEAYIYNFILGLITEHQTTSAKKYLYAYRYYEDRNWYKKLQRKVNSRGWNSFNFIERLRGCLKSDKPIGEFSRLNDQAALRIKNRLETLLRWEDLNSMRYSIETRLPYLDYDFFSYAMKFKPRDLFSLEGTKAPLREYIHNADPKYKLIPSKKLGYSVQKENIAKIYFEDSYNLKLMKELRLKDWNALSVSRVNAHKKNFQA